MLTYVAFLRGINVGGKNIIKMDRLKQVFEEMGFDSVKTYIQSGNVVFQSKSKNKKLIETQIEKVLSLRFKYKAKVLIRSEKDMSKTVKSFPKIFKNPRWKHNVIFLGDSINSNKILKSLDTKKDIESLSYVPGVLFWSAQIANIGRTTMIKLSSKKEYQEMTVRNINTTRKILELMSEVNSLSPQELL